MSTLTRALTEAGLDQFRAYLAGLREGAAQEPPTHLLEDVGCTRELTVGLALDRLVFATRLDAARYLCEQLGPMQAEEADRDAGLWAWLSLYFFDQVCPPGNDGMRRPGQDYRHIPDFGYLHRHRHLLYGPYQVYRRHGEGSALLLSGPLHSESGVYHEIASRRDLIANPGVVEAATLLYFDGRRRAPKPGAQGPLTRPGTVRRFVRVLQQLDMTYDIYGLRGEQLLELLPPEFDAWRPPRELRLSAEDRHERATDARKSASDLRGS